MKILQLNVWGGCLGKQIIEVLKREDPDIVCFQEALVFPKEKQGDLFFSTLDKFRHEGAFTHSFFSPVFGFSYMNEIAQFGNAVLSKSPFQKTETMFTRKEYVEHQDMFGDFNVRNLQHVEIEVDGGTINVLNHHGHHLSGHKNGDEETLRQCTLIADYIQKLQGPTVLCGDFNLSPESESIGQINSILVNHPKERGVITTRTPLTHKTEVCDYIFTSPDTEVSNFQVLDDIVSDHKALIVEF